MFMPAYSSPFNSIETVWAMLRRRVLNRFALLQVQRLGLNTHDVLKELIRSTCDDVDDQSYINILRAN